MRKIETVVNGCNDCKFMQKVVETGGNTYFAAICCFSRFQSEEEKPHPDTLVKSGVSNSIFSNHIGIPSNCPLEDYKINP